MSTKREREKKTIPPFHAFTNKFILIFLVTDIDQYMNNTVNSNFNSSLTYEISKGVMRLSRIFKFGSLTANDNNGELYLHVGYLSLLKASLSDCCSRDS